MAKTKTAAPAGTEARALVDLPEFGVRSGGLVSAAADVLAALAKVGSVDLHPEAVEYAKGQGMPSQLDRASAAD